MDIAATNNEEWYFLAFLLSFLRKLFKRWVFNNDKDLSQKYEQILKGYLNRIRLYIRNIEKI